MKISKYKEFEYPEIGTKYWNILCQVWSSTWCGHFIDKTNFDTGNYYETKEQADSEFEWRLLNTQILNTIAILNKEDDWVVDWEDGNQEKWYFAWNRESNKVTSDYEGGNQHYENNRYTSSLGIGKLTNIYNRKELKFWLTKGKV